jgi:hypothetical protein
MVYLFLDPGSRSLGNLSENLVKKNCNNTLTNYNNRIIYCIDNKFTIRHNLNMKKLIKKIFTDLDQAIELENLQRLKDGTLAIQKSEVLLLGQMSLMVNDSVAPFLDLIQTGDMDARLRMDYFTKTKLMDLLEANGLVYDEDSHLIWIPEKTKEIEVFKFKYIEVKLIDAESALVSKAIHAPEKNKHLIRQAIASGKFPDLVNRIIENNGQLDYFLEDNNG